MARKESGEAFRMADSDATSTIDDGRSASGANALAFEVRPANGAVYYTQIVDAIAAAVQRGTLRPGQRLPSQRDLARHLGIALGTVSRAYAEAARRGLISGNVGRGTFVSSAPLPAVVSPASTRDEVIDLAMNRPSFRGCSSAFADTLGRISRRNDLSYLLSHQPAAGRLEHRAAGAALIGATGLAAEPERVIVVNGVQHGLAVVLGALSRPGDLVVTEGINYAGIRLAARIYDLRLVGLPGDSEGLLPEALEEVCRRERPRFLFCTPTMQNPTSATMGAGRRQAIADIVARHNLILIEDDIFGLMPEAPHLPISALIPERSYYLTGTSKCLSAGIRLGYIMAPPGAGDELIMTAQATNWMASPLMAAIVTEWLNEGEIERIIDANRAEARQRQAVAADRLAGFGYQSHPVGFHLWLQLPDPWRQAEFVMQARSRNIVIPSSEIFAIGRTEIPHAVRISLGAAADLETLRAGLERLTLMIAKGPQFDTAIV